MLSELDFLGQTGRSEAPIITLSRPLPARKGVPGSLWAMAVAWYLLVHGFPLLLNGLMPQGSRDPAEYRSHSNLSPAAEAKLNRVVRDVIQRLHISNQRQLRMLFLVPGALFTVSGIVVFVWANKRQNRQAREIDRLYDLNVAKITLADPGMPSLFRSW